MALLANRIAAALSPRTWGVSDAARCHLFLLAGGRASWAGSRQSPIEFTAPAMLWLPHAAGGKLVIAAGGDGFGAAIDLDLVQRAVGDPTLAVHLRPLLTQTVLAGSDMLAHRLPALTAPFAALVEEAQGQHPAAAAMAGLHLATLLLTLWRCTGLPGEAGRRGAGATTAQRFRQLVELHYREAIGIDGYAARLRVTRSHLHEACLRATGHTPLTLLHDRLMAEARTRLTQTDLSVEQVGYGLGFRDPGYFNRFFRRLSGQPPGVFRRAALASRPPAEPPSFAAWP